VIVRVMGEGQYELDDALLPELEALDAPAERAVEAGDEAAFATALGALLARVREAGRPLAPERLQPSDVVLPAPDATVEDVRHLFEGGGTGLVPG
jgi:hypothetical protein